jgi:hypothetical protein
VSVTARMFLETVLRVRPAQVRHVHRVSSYLGLSWKAVRRAKLKLPVRTTRVGFPPRTTWVLGGPPPTPLEKAEAELLLAMWEYRIQLRKVVAAKRRIQDLGKVLECVKAKGGSL